MLFSSFLPPHPSTSWPMLSAKTIFTSERLGLEFLTTVLHTLSTLCCHQCRKTWQTWEENPAQNLTALKEKDQAASGVSPGWRITSSQPMSHSHGHSSHVLCHGSPPLAPPLATQAMQAFLIVGLKAHSKSR